MDHRVFLLVEQIADELPDLSAYSTLRLARRLAPWISQESPHDRLVRQILANPRLALDLLSDGKSFYAIRNLRTLTGCSFQEAKNAINDPRVTEAVQNP